MQTVADDLVCESQHPTMNLRTRSSRSTILGIESGLAITSPPGNMTRIALVLEVAVLKWTGSDD